MIGKGSRNRFKRPTVRDAIAGLVTGLFSIPEGMAYASIGGFAAPLGLWSGVVPTIIGSMFARTVLMVTTLTSAIALSSASVLHDAGLKPSDIGAIATLTVMVGVVMLALGLLKLGSVMSYVSTAVMTGFTTGIALQIAAGVLDDATGYSPTSSNTVGKFINAFTHIGEWQLAPVLVTIATVAVWLVFRLIKPTKSLATLVALIVVSIAATLLHANVQLVSDISAIPRSLPPVTVPDVSTLPALATGAFAVALVALAQAAGISAAVANPDGSRGNASTDFSAQGLGNIAGGFFGALPTGGSLSRTGVATSAGSGTRWAGIFAGVWLALIVVTIGPLAGYIPMAVIGGLMFVIAGELIVGRRRDILLVLRTSPMSSLAMIVTFVATTGLPLQQAIFLGAALSILLTAVTAAKQGRIILVTRDTAGNWRIGDPPDQLPSNQTTVLHYPGSVFFSEVNRLDQEWPDTSQTKNAALVVSMRGSGYIPSATFLKSFDARIERLRAQGIEVVLCGIPKHELDILTKTKSLDSLGAENIFPSSDVLLESLTEAYGRAESLRTRKG
ncbi:SulP family inorganic anion transporter (plasmid) [Coraliomargarita sp. W4R53]